MFLIRNFGNDIECNNGHELMNRLQELYKGKSVSIQYHVKSGIKMTEFVDVSKGGDVTYSYQNNQPFSAIELEAKADL